MPREEWGHPDGERPDEQPNWDPDFGDRAQQIVFIGQKLDEAGIRARLDACLLDEQELEDRDAWGCAPNPFPTPELAEEPA